MGQGLSLLSIPEGWSSARPPPVPTSSFWSIIGCGLNEVIQSSTPPCQNQNTPLNPEEKKPAPARREKEKRKGDQEEKKGGEQQEEQKADSDSKENQEAPREADKAPAVPRDKEPEVGLDPKTTALRKRGGMVTILTLLYISTLLYIC